MITYAGAAYLAYLGVNALRSKGGIAAKLAAGKQVNLRTAARDGLMISLLNPKLALFFFWLCLVSLWPLEQRSPVER